MFALANTDCVYPLSFLDKSLLNMGLPTVVIAVLFALASRTARALQASKRKHERQSQSDEFDEETNKLKAKRDMYYEGGHKPYLPPPPPHARAPNCCPLSLDKPPQPWSIHHAHEHTTAPSRRPVAVQGCSTSLSPCSFR